VSYPAATVATGNVVPSVDVPGGYGESEVLVVLVVRSPRPVAMVAAAMLTVLALTACSADRSTSAPEPNGNGGTNTTGVGPSTAAGPSASAEPAGTGGDPCLLLPVADVQSAVGQAIKTSRRLTALATETGASQQCNLEIAGKAIGAADLATISTAATTLSNRQIDVKAANAAKTATIEVAVAQFATALTASSFPGTALPTGAKRVSGIGLAAVVMTTPNGSIGAALVDTHRAVYVVDLEGRSVPTSQMQKLLKSAVSHAG
jgi:hypothetical protein